MNKEYEIVPPKIDHNNAIVLDGMPAFRVYHDNGRFFVEFKDRDKIRNGRRGGVDKIRIDLDLLVIFIKERLKNE